MSEMPTRNGWTIAEHVRDRTPDKTQRLLSRAVWDEAAAMAEIRRFAVSGLENAARKSGRRRGKLMIGALDVIKVVPDKAQFPVRVRALRENKVVYMAVPRLAKQHPFYLLDPAELSVPADVAASSDGAEAVARNVGVEELRPIDLVICGSVAVNRDGVRLGKGAGYSDIEVALLQEAGLIGPSTTIATTVHSLQIVDGDLPETEHDFSMDLIITPSEVIACGPARRPPGLIWDHLSPEKIAAIPTLAARAKERP